MRQGGAIAIGNLVKTYGEGEGGREREREVHVYSNCSVCHLEIVLFLLL